LYNSDACQVVVACLIVANFLTNICEKQILPEEDSTGYYVFEGLELFYNVAFTIELGINIYGHWFCLFWHSSWNIFDVVVVVIGIIDTAKVPLPKALTLLRTIRAFRVFRLFRRVESLNKILRSITHAMPGVANAFLILPIIMAIFAILAVEFYKDVGKGCVAGETWMTARELCMGQEYFGNFIRSYYTFFQVLTGDSWSENIARPCIWYFDDWTQNLGSGLFYVGFVIITAFILQNVVVAVLLDKMVGSTNQQETLSDDEKNVAEKVCRMQDALAKAKRESEELRTAVSQASISMGEVKTLLASLQQAVTEHGKSRDV